MKQQPIAVYCKITWINHGIPVAATQRRRRERGPIKKEKEEGREGRREKREGGEGRKREGRKKREGEEGEWERKGGSGGGGGEHAGVGQTFKERCARGYRAGIIYDVPKVESAAFGATN